MTDISASQKSQNLWFSVSLGLIGLIVGYMFSQYAGNSPRQVAVQSPPASSVPSAQDVPAPQPPPPVDKAKDHLLGSANARLSLIVYSDYDCPYSKRHHPTLAKILETYGKDVNVVFRHFPLSFHPTAQIKAEAAECVAEVAGNSAFWSFTDALYADNPVPMQTVDDLVKIGKSVGADENQLRTCIQSGKTKQIVKDDEQGGTTAGISGTPGSILVDHRNNTTKVLVGAQPFDAFKTAIDADLAT